MTEVKTDPTGWEQDVDWGYGFEHQTIDVSDVRFVQPIGFVWFQKPRYRVKCLTRKR